MDKLFTCAKAFESLFDVEYRVTVAHKTQKADLRIVFNPIDFHHLMGLGKLKDLRVHREPRIDVFNKIISGKISYDTIKRSRHIHEIENRFEPLSHIEELFDSNYLTFRYRQQQNPMSTIVADYLVSADFQDNDIYIFLASKLNSGTFFCRSFFPKTNKDYTIGQTKWTLLRKEKTTLSTGESVVQYER